MSDYIYIVNLSIYLHKYLCISPIERYLYIHSILETQNENKQLEQLQNISFHFPQKNESH